MNPTARRATSGEERPLAEQLAEADALIPANPTRAAERLERLIVQAREANDRLSEATAHLLRGNTLLFTAHYLAAQQEYEVTLDLVRELADTGTLQARAINGLGLTARAQGDYGRAMQNFLEALRLTHEHGDELTRARILNNIGVVRAEIGEHALALEAHLEVRALCETLGDVVIHSSATVNVIEDYYHLGEYDRALALAAEYLPLIRERGLSRHEMLMQTRVVMTLTAAGQPTEATALGQELLPLAHELEDEECVAQLHLMLGLASQQLGDHAASATHLMDTLERTRARKLRRLERNVLHGLATLHAEQQAWHKAYEFACAYHRLERELHAQEVDHRIGMFNTQVQLEVLRRQAQLERRRNEELQQANAALEVMQEQLAYRAAHDPLTGLANRAHFQATLERVLRQTGTPFALLFIDLDHFKRVNDTLGHGVGDQLLCKVAHRLRRVTPPDTLVARMGGDEFMVLLPDAPCAEHASRTARQILSRLARPFDVSGHRLHLTGSIGAVMAPQDGQDVTTLQKHADIAMYRAKHEGKNCLRFFSAEMAEETARRAEIERHLRDALARHEFRLHYQAQFEVPSQALMGFEALVRWQHPTRGLLSPGMFVGVAEESGLIVPLGNWVLREACAQAMRWDANTRGFTVSVNVSPEQFHHPDFSQTVRCALEVSGLNPARLILELTESVVLREPQEAAQQLGHLRDLGVRVALDDFGQGQSSLGLLRRLPIDFLKIDRSFLQGDSPDDAGDRAEQGTHDGVRRVGGKHATRAMVELMVNLAHLLNMQVIAEGVETPEQAEMLRSLNCDHMQGFLLARPVPPEEAAKLLVTLPPE